MRRAHGMKPHPIATVPVRFEQWVRPVAWSQCRHGRSSHPWHPALATTFAWAGGDARMSEIRHLVLICQRMMVAREGGAGVGKSRRMCRFRYLSPNGMLS